MSGERAPPLHAAPLSSGRFAYLATGGCSALNPRKADPDDPYSRFNILRDRHVILYPDADMIHKWMDAADALRPVCRTVRAVDVRREPFSLTGSQDIGDYILESVAAADAAG